MKLICRRCSKHISANESVWCCECGGIIDLNFTAKFPLKEIGARKFDMWRYREAIPLEGPDEAVYFGEGFTPLVETEYRAKKVFLKLEYLFPSGSFKDRGAAVLINRLRELGVRRVVEDSSGNAGAAIATYCARAGIECDIYVPEGTSGTKVAQIKGVGANLRVVNGDREAAAEAARLAARRYCYASHVWNPFFFHGTKTFAFELAEQLGWKSPDVLVLPVGNGTLLLGAYIGFREMKREGIIEKLPEIIAVQATNCAPLYQAWKNNSMVANHPEARDTIAEGIAIARPARARQILEAVRDTGGKFVTVVEDEIRQALSEAGERGFFIEPSAAVALAGFSMSRIEDKLVVVPLTGHGLKSAH